jgi:hypothetical protein
MPPTVPAGGYELDALTDRERQIPLPMVNSIDLLFAQQIRALNQEQPVLMSAQRPSQIRTGNDSCGQMHRVRRPQAAPLANVVATSAVTGSTVRRSSHPSNPASAATSSADPSRIGFANTSGSNNTEPTPASASRLRREQRPYQLSQRVVRHTRVDQHVGIEASITARDQREPPLPSPAHARHSRPAQATLGRGLPIPAPRSPPMNDECPGQRPGHSSSGGPDVAA